MEQLESPPVVSYVRTTRSICVTVEPEYLEDQSDPIENRYAWAYHVSIENQGGETVQLLRRTWRITDAGGITQIVEGEGVVGEQPVLDPGDMFQYTSGTPLGTASGIMVGAYHMVSGSGEHFDVEIPAFSLDTPFDKPLMH